MPEEAPVISAVPSEEGEGKPTGRGYPHDRPGRPRFASAATRSTAIVSLLPPLVDLLGMADVLVLELRGVRVELPRGGVPGRLLLGAAAALLGGRLLRLAVGLLDPLLGRLLPLARVLRPPPAALGEPFRIVRGHSRRPRPPGVRRA